MLKGLIIQLERHVPHPLPLALFDLQMGNSSHIVTKAYNALQTSPRTQSFLPCSVVKTGAEYPVH